MGWEGYPHLLVSVEVDKATAAAVEQLLAECPEKLTTAFNRAVNHEAKKALTVISQTLRKQTGLTMARFRRHLRLYQARKQALAAHIGIGTRRLAVEQLAAEQTPPGVMYAWPPTRTLARSAFFAVVGAGAGKVRFKDEPKGPRRPRSQAGFRRLAAAGGGHFGVFERFGAPVLMSRGRWAGTGVKRQRLRTVLAKSLADAYRASPGLNERVISTTTANLKERLLHEAGNILRQKKER